MPQPPAPRVPQPPAPPPPQPAPAEEAEAAAPEEPPPPEGEGTLTESQAAQAATDSLAAMQKFEKMAADRDAARVARESKVELLNETSFDRRRQVTGDGTAACAGGFGHETCTL